jgi:membrane fusion protein (multidrug efflux system)
MKNIWVGLGVLAALALGIAGYWFFFMRGTVTTDDARFSGHLVDLAPEIYGRIVEIAVHEGQAVRRGDIIFRIDPTSAEAAAHQAEASLVSARASLASAQAKYEKAVNGSRPEEIRAGEATLRRLQNQEELARLELARAESLTKTGAAAQDALDNARSACESARQSRENAGQNLALLQQGSRAEDVAAAKADAALAESRIAEATAALAHARSELDHYTLCAPFDGWVVRRWLDAGATPIPGQAVVSLFDPATLRVDANIEEKYLHEIQIGDEADLAIDAYPDLHLKGRIVEILRGTNSQFSLIPAEGVAGTFIKVTQRVPLRIAVTAPPELPLGPGLSVEVKIRCGTAAPAGPALARP